MEIIRELLSQFSPGHVTVRLDRTHSVVADKGKSCASTAQSF